MAPKAADSTLRSHLHKKAYHFDLRVEGGVHIHDHRLDLLALLAE
nr:MULTISPECIES: hypothetical protein [Pseudomonas]